MYSGELAFFNFGIWRNFRFKLTSLLPLLKIPIPDPQVLEKGWKPVLFIMNPKTSYIQTFQNFFSLLAGLAFRHAKGITESERPFHPSLNCLGNMLKLNMILGYFYIAAKAVKFGKTEK